MGPLSPVAATCLEAEILLRTLMGLAAVSLRADVPFWYLLARAQRDDGKDVFEVFRMNDLCRYLGRTGRWRLNQNQERERRRHTARKGGGLHILMLLVVAWGLALPLVGPVWGGDVQWLRAWVLRLIYWGLPIPAPPLSSCVDWHSHIICPWL